MVRRFGLLSLLAIVLCFLIFQLPSIVLAQKEPRKKAPPIDAETFDRSAKDYAGRLLAEGKQTFRYDTFGSEEFWGGTLKLHNAIQGAKHGGVGPGVSPKMALELGLKVDSDAVPKQVASGELHVSAETYERT